MLCNSNQTLTSIYDITVHTHKLTTTILIKKERIETQRGREWKDSKVCLKKWAEISERKTMSRFWGEGVRKNFRFISKSYIVRSSKWWWYFIPITLCRLNFFFPPRWNRARSFRAPRWMENYDGQWLCDDHDDDWSWCCNEDKSKIEQKEINLRKSMYQRDEMRKKNNQIKKFSRAQTGQHRD